MKVYLIVISILTLTTSCSTFLYEELAYIHKGMTLEETCSVIDNDDFDEGIDLFNDDINEDYFSAENNYKFLVTEKFTSLEPDYYVFLFQNNKLVYWGTPYQIANHTNPSISNTSYIISKTIKEKYID